jgi:hypothetical protein
MIGNHLYIKSSDDDNHWVEILKINDLPVDKIIKHSENK